jgi:uncharacterized protein (TIGR00251 family)
MKKSDTQNEQDRIIINVKVQPRSSKSEIMAIKDGVYKIKLKSAPVDGKANEELIELLADKYKVKKSDIEIKSGKNSQNKIIKIQKNVMHSEN